MYKLITQQELHGIRKMPFCYLCGNTILHTDRTSRDHVPPQALFAIQDKDHPLILDVHATCNTNQSMSDEILVIGPENTFSGELK